MTLADIPWCQKCGRPLVTTVNTARGPKPTDFKHINCPPKAKGY